MSKGHSASSSGLILPNSVFKRAFEKPSFKPAKYVVAIPLANPIIQFTVDGVKLTEFMNASDAARVSCF